MVPLYDLRARRRIHGRHSSVADGCATHRDSASLFALLEKRDFYVRSIRLLGEGFYSPYQAGSRPLHPTAQGEEPETVNRAAMAAIFAPSPGCIVFLFDHDLCGSFVSIGSIPTGTGFKVKAAMVGWARPLFGLCAPRAA